MRFTEHELTAALTGAAKSVLAAKDKSVRKGKRSVDEAWDALTQYERFQLLDGLGDQVLPVLVSLPDVEVAAGTRPTFTDAQVRAAVEARLALVRLALESVPPRQDPDALIVPDHL